MSSEIVMVKLRVDLLLFQKGQEHRRQRAGRHGDPFFFRIGLCFFVRSFSKKAGAPSMRLRPRFRVTIEQSADDAEKTVCLLGRHMRADGSSDLVESMRLPEDEDFDDAESEEESDSDDDSSESDDSEASDSSSASAGDGVWRHNHNSASRLSHNDGVWRR